MIRQLKILMALVALLISACGEPVIYEKQITWQDQQWLAGDTADFELQLPDTNQLVDLQIRLDHSADFAYQNLYVKAITGFPDGKETDQVLSLQLTDGPASWSGECKGDRCVTELVLSNGVRIPEAGTYRFRFVQYSRMDTLSGVNGMSFRVLPHQSGEE